MSANRMPDIMYRRVEAVPRLLLCSCCFTIFLQRVRRSRLRILLRGSTPC